MIAIIEYNFGKFSSTIKVYCEEDESDQIVIERAMEKLKEELKGDIPDTWQSWRVLDRS